MDFQEKLEILADSAKYDASCSSSGAGRKNEGGVGSAEACGICHAWSSDGRCISLLKVLMSNRCCYDCSYCVNRASNPRKRASFTPEQLAELTIAFYRRNYIEGLFLSSAVERSPDYTMERMLEALRLIREKERFGGYIHVKVIPGASPDAIARVAGLADRVSVNIELPSSESLGILAPQKKPEQIFTPMRQLLDGQRRLMDERHIKSAPRFMPAGQTTQMIIGASGESDRKILLLSQGLYNKYKMRRVYYSAYVPVGDETKLPALKNPPLLREHRLYQCDFLQRQYEFEADEILPESHPFLDPLIDPKCAWALRNIDQFPVEINKAPFEILIRIPGIGRIGAQRIVKARRLGPLHPEDIKKMGLSLKRARFFITCQGRYIGGLPLQPELLYRALTTQERINAPSGLYAAQTNLFSDVPQMPRLDAPVELPLLGAPYGA